MAEMLVQSESLASIADIIREKGGTSNALVFPDGFVTAISAIQAGGNLSAIGVSKMDSGTITMASSTTLLNISHQLGAMPKIIFVYTKDYGVVLSGGDRTIASVFGAVFEDTDGDSRAIRQVTGKGNVNWTTLDSLASNISQGGFPGVPGTYGKSGFSDVTEHLIQCSYTNGAGFKAYFVAGATYEWLALA